MQRLYGCPLDKPGGARRARAGRRAAAAPGSQGLAGGGHPARPVPRRRARRQPVGSPKTAGWPTWTSASWANSRRAGGTAADMLYTAHVSNRDFERVARGLRRCGVLDSAVGTDAQLGWVLGALFGPLLDAPISRLNSRRITDMLLATARQYFRLGAPGADPVHQTTALLRALLRRAGPEWVWVRPVRAEKHLPRRAAERAARAGPGDAGLTSGWPARVIRAGESVNSSRFSKR